MEYFTASEYFELARSLLELYRCEKLLRLELEWKEHEVVDDTLVVLKKIVELCVNTVAEKYRSHEYREKLQEHLRTLSESEVKMLREYLKLGLQLAGLNLTPLAPFLSDKLFIQYLGVALKTSAIIVVAIKKYWASRAVRKFSVEVERLAREIIERLEERESKLEKSIGVMKDIVGSTTSQYSLAKLTRRLYNESVYANTPEVLAFAIELQELRRKLLGAK